MQTLKTKIKEAYTLIQKIALVQTLLQQSHLSKRQIELKIAEIVNSMPDAQIEEYIAGNSISKVIGAKKAPIYQTQAELKACVIEELKNGRDPRTLAKRFVLPLNVISGWKRDLTPKINNAEIYRMSRKMVEIRNNRPTRIEYLCEKRHYFVSNLPADKAFCPNCQSRNLILAQNAQVKVGKI